MISAIAASWSQGSCIEAWCRLLTPCARGVEVVADTSVRPCLHCFLTPYGYGQETCSSSVLCRCFWHLGLQACQAEGQQQAYIHPPAYILLKIGPGRTSRHLLVSPSQRRLTNSMLLLTSISLYRSSVPTTTLRKICSTAFLPFPPPLCNSPTSCCNSRTYSKLLSTGRRTPWVSSGSFPVHRAGTGLPTGGFGEGELGVGPAILSALANPAGIVPQV